MPHGGLCILLTECIETNLLIKMHIVLDLIIKIHIAMFKIIKLHREIYEVILISKIIMIIFLNFDAEDHLTCQYSYKTDFIYAKNYKIKQKIK